MCSSSITSRAICHPWNSTKTSYPVEKRRIHTPPSWRSLFDSHPSREERIQPKGLPIIARLALLDTRFKDYQHAVIGTVLTTLHAGSVLLTFYPNFNLSLDDPNLPTTLKVQIQKVVWLWDRSNQQQFIPSVFIVHRPYFQHPVTKLFWTQDQAYEWKTVPYSFPLDHDRNLVSTLKL